MTCQRIDGSASSSQSEVVDSRLGISVGANKLHKHIVRLGAAELLIIDDTGRHSGDPISTCFVPIGIDSVFERPAQNITLTLAAHVFDYSAISCL